MLEKLACPYVIDPHTYVFADTSEIADRRWFDKLVAEYGINMMTDPDRPFLSPGLLVNGDSPTGSLKELVHNVLDYQKSTIEDTVADADEYSGFESDNVENDWIRTPRWYVPPYFFIENKESEWLTVNIKSAELAKNTLGSADLYAMIMINHEILSDDGAVDEIVSAYHKLSVDGYMIWVTTLDETRARESELTGFQKFVDKLSRAGRPIYNAYGGLFSLANEKICGTSHAICYGEHKNPFEVASGGYPARFYLHELYSKIPYGRMQEITHALALEECNCRYCVDSGAAHALNEFEHAGLHFLECRTADLARIEENGGTAFFEHLLSAFDRVRRNDKHDVYSGFYGHLKTWHNAICSYTRRTKE